MSEEAGPTEEEEIYVVGRRWSPETWGNRVETEREPAPSEIGIHEVEVDWDNTR